MPLDCMIVIMGYHVSCCFDAIFASNCLFIATTIDDFVADHLKVQQCPVGSSSSAVADYL